MKCRYPRCALFLFLAAMLCLAGSCGEHESPSSEAVRVGYIPFSADLPFFVAMEEGFFEQQNVAPKPVRFAVSSECLNATVAGQVDMAMGNSLSALFAIQQKQPGKLRIFLPMIETEENHVSHLLVKQGSPIVGVEGLRGRSVGTYTGATQLLYLRLFLQSQGLNPEEDVRIVQVAPNLQIQALEAGQYDALFTIEPYCAMAMELAKARSVLSFARGRILSPFPGGAFAVNSTFLQEHPAACRRMVAALDKASDFIRTNPAEAKRALTKYTPVDEEIALKSGVYEWLPLDRLTPGVLEELQEEANLFAKYQVLDGPVETKGMLLRAEELGY